MSYDDSWYDDYSEQKHSSRNTNSRIYVYRGHKREGVPFIFGQLDNIINKAIQFNNAALTCALTEPNNIQGCISDKMEDVSPSVKAGKIVGMGELDLSPEDLLIDGIVVNAERAKSTPCKCINYNGEDLCWSPGIIGMLSQEQIPQYCPEKHYETSPKLVEHLNKFKQAVEATKGMPLQERLNAIKSILESKNAVRAADTDEGHDFVDIELVPIDYIVLCGDEEVYMGADREEALKAYEDCVESGKCGVIFHFDKQIASNYGECLDTELYEPVAHSELDDDFDDFFGGPVVDL